MGLLNDILADNVAKQNAWQQQVNDYATGLKNKLVGLLQDPAGAVNSFANGLQQQTDNNLALANQSGWAPTVYGKTTATPQQQALARALLADQGAQQGIAGTFIGKSAKTWDAGAAAKAQQMEQQGVPARQIWSETGTWKGPDGQWRQEIADNKAVYDPEALADLKANPSFDYLSDTQPLGGVIGHKGLYAAYPDLADAQVHFMPQQNMRGAYGAYSEPLDALTLSQGTPNSGQVRAAIHESQHAIQARENWARGGNSALAFKDPATMDIYQGLLKNMNTPMSLQDYAKGAWGTSAITPEIEAAYKDYASQVSANITPAIDRAAQETATKTYYKNLAGEAEARATQARLPLTAAQRRATFPEDSYDVPINQLIIRGLLK